MVSLGFLGLFYYPLVILCRLLGHNAVVSSIGTMSSSEKITLKSSDGKVFEVEKAVALESQTIKHVIEDCDDNIIPLPNVSAKILAKVIEYCKKHVESTSADERTSDEDLEAWDTGFARVDQATLCGLIMAANYLNIKSLSHLTSRTLSDMIRGKTPEEIRKTFNIKDDFTPEEDMIRGKTPEEIRKTFNIKDDFTPEEEKPWEFR